MDSLHQLIEQRGALEAAVLIAATFVTMIIYFGLIVWIIETSWRTLVELAGGGK